MKCTRWKFGKERKKKQKLLKPQRIDAGKPQNWINKILLLREFAIHIKSVTSRTE